MAPNAQGLKYHHKNTVEMVLTFAVLHWFQGRIKPSGIGYKSEEEECTRKPSKKHNLNKRMIPTEVMNDGELLCTGQHHP